MLCAMSIRTSGPNPNKHDIVQICIVALDHRIQMADKIPPFMVDIKPRRPENIDYKLCEVTKKQLVNIGINGLDAYDAADRYDEWFEFLKLPKRKRIVPLVYNWSKMKPFLLDWLGFENCDQTLADQVRDLLPIAVAANDKACAKGKPCPYKKPTFSYLAHIANCYRYAKDCGGDCFTLIQTYNYMLKHESLLL